MSQSLADIYRSALDSAAEFEKTMTNAREKCIAELHGQAKPENDAADDQGKRKAA